jgi:hypothetical protein
MPPEESSLPSEQVVTRLAKNERVRKVIVPDLVLVGLLIAYFIHFALRSLPAPFRPDDMMNMWHYWNAGWTNTVRASLCFWSSI